MDAADFDHAVGRVHPHEGRDAAGEARRKVDDRVTDVSRCGGGLRNPFSQFGLVRKRAMKQVGPGILIGILERPDQIVAVLLGIKRLKSSVRAFENFSRWNRTRRPVR